MKKIWKSILMLCLIVLFFFFTHIVSNATDSNESYSIHIIKYRLEEHENIQDNFPSNGTQMNDWMDGAGNQLEKMSGIAYNITRMNSNSDETDDDNLSSYEVTTGSDAFSMDIVTNEKGEAVINGLTKGVYKVTELPNKEIKKVMEPSLVRLPLTTNNEQLNNVYIYPKSSVISNDINVVRSGRTKLPETSGNLGSNWQIILMLLMIVSLSFFSICRINRRIHN